MNDMHGDKFMSLINNIKNRRISNPLACLLQSSLVPHMAALLEFLGTDLMTDVNPKVVLHAIEAHETVVVQGGEQNHGNYYVPYEIDGFYQLWRFGAG